MNNNSRKVISAALAILMSTAVLPANTLVGNSSVVEARNVDPNMANLPQDLQKALGEAKAYGDELAKMKDDQNSSEQIQKMLEGFKLRINGARSAEEVDKAVEKCKADAASLIKATANAKASQGKMLVYEGEEIIRKLESFSEYEAVTRKVITPLKNGIGTIIDQGTKADKTVKDTIEGINAEIDEMGNKRKAALAGKLDYKNAMDKEVQDIIDKIKDADSFDKLDDISIPNKLMFNSDIIKAKSDRRQEITDGIDNRYSDYSTEEKLDVRSIEIREDKDNRGKWIVEGKVHDHIRKDVSVYYDGRYVGGGVTDGEGYFEITVNERVYDNSSLNFYAGKRKDFDRDDVKISPWDLKVSTYYVEGKYNKDTNIKVYYRGRYVGEGRTDKDGKFRIKCDEQIFNKGDLTFYKTDGSNDSAGISIISANAGDTKVTGRSSDFAEIVIKDKDNVRLGNAKADKDGNFTVFLNRALVSGEVLSITVTDKDRDEINTEYTVGAVQGNGSYKMAYAKGYPNGYFKAGANISRAEAVTMLARLMNGSDVFNTPKTTKFEDAEDGWYAQTINYVVDRGIMKGYPDGDFEPDAYITRAEFATMVSRYVKKSNPGGSDLKDIRNHWAKEAIETLYGNKIIQGYPDGTFKPEENITRAEAVTVLNAAFGRKSNLRSMDNISNPEMLITFNDVRKSDWYYAQVLDAANSHESYMNGDYEVWTIVK